jgi:hypothetical protein
MDKQRDFFEFDIKFGHEPSKASPALVYGVGPALMFIKPSVALLYTFLSM